MTYGSIDELLGRHIAPMNDLVEEALNHRKFMDLSEDEVDHELVAQKKANPSSIPYAFCWLEDHAGYLSLRFAVSNKPKHFIVSITPKGYFWSGKLYETLDLLTNDFKKKSMKSRAESRNGGAQPSKQPDKPKLPSHPPNQNVWQDKSAQTQPEKPQTRWDPVTTALPVHAPPPIRASAAPVTITDWRPLAPPQPPPPPRPPNWGPQVGRAQPPPPVYRQPPTHPHIPPPPHSNLKAPPQLNLPPPPITRPLPPSFEQPASFTQNQQQATGRGRGVARTLPAWMNNRSS
jgi:SH2 domain